MSERETNYPTDLCAEVVDSLASVLDGSAAPRLIEHIADCDHCRDLRHDATATAERVAHAGADFRAPADFADRLIAKLNEARPDGTDRPRASEERSVSRPEPTAVPSRAESSPDVSPAAFTLATAPTMMDSRAASERASDTSDPKPASVSAPPDGAPIAPVRTASARDESASDSGVAARDALSERRSIRENQSASRAIVHADTNPARSEAASEAARPIAPA
jgi:hypothetical protein